MITICVISPKGGTGKTTVSAHLAVAASHVSGKSVVVFDTDPQKSLAAWWNGREADDIEYGNIATLEVLEEALAKCRSLFDIAIIDTPPAMTSEIKRVVSLSDFILIMTRASPLDLRALGTGIKLVQEAKKPFAFAVNNCRPTARLTVQTMGQLSRYGAVCEVPISSREGYASAMTDGRTIQEVEPKGKGAQEVAALWAFVSEMINTKVPVEG